MEEGKKLDGKIEIEYLGKNKMFLHKRIGSGTYGKKKINLNQINNGTIIFQLCEKNAFESWSITPDALTKAFIGVLK